MVCPLAAYHPHALRRKCKAHQQAEPGQKCTNNGPRASAVCFGDYCKVGHATHPAKRAERAAIDNNEKIPPVRRTRNQRPASDLRDSMGAWHLSRETHEDSPGERAARACQFCTFDTSTLGNCVPGIRPMCFAILLDGDCCVFDCARGNRYFVCGEPARRYRPSPKQEGTGGGPTTSSPRRQRTLCDDCSIISRPKHAVLPCCPPNE